jgi:hypothetical protein
MYNQKIRANATREQRGVSTVGATPKTPVRPRKRKCGGQEKGSQSLSPDRKTEHVDETKDRCPSDEFQIDQTQKTLQLPKGASSFIMTHPESGQPTRIKLPPTKPNQNWCTVRVNIPERQVTCPDLNVSLSVKTLKETTVLAEKEKTVIRIPVANQGEDQNFGVLAEGIRYKEARPIIANKVASRIREYFSLLNTPNNAGSYNWRGGTLSKAEIEKRIKKLGLSAWN